jgi:tRNA-Thr(GGU) m(6)t(6)A37 methyltransferase TsaA
MLLPNMNFEQALQDLAGFEKIWLIYWFHLNPTWKPKVLPPRSTNFKKRGVFATRSPHRPNPLGLSLVTLVSIEGRVLKVADTDLLDGTPILDIKPYLPYAEAFPDAKMGWLDEEIAAEKNYDIELSELFKIQHEWLFKNFDIDLLKTISPVLKSNPEPHPYRRITHLSEADFEIAVKSWRVHFSIFKNVVTLLKIESGYGIQEIVLAPENSLHDDKAHREFLKVWTF